MRRALFLDRDGVINVDHGYVGRPEQFEVMPGVEVMLRSAQAAEYLLIVVTNQSGIARGYFSAEDYARLENHIRATFLTHGIRFDGIYHCPHAPDEGCACRKPAPGMIMQAARELDVDLGASVLVGDKHSDIDAAKAAGVGRTFLITGKPYVDADQFSRIAAELR